MATGRQTFGGGTTAIVFDAILNRDPQPINALNAEVNPELERVRSSERSKRTASFGISRPPDLRADLQRIKRKP
jgi:hypothetical protein